ncbi:MAG: hypothetical protein JSV54_05895 [Chloroflexota bacterium]|nr:MAG: hypothetical protein JSV54_05895 [Chloroflexota bacterium]
MRKLSLLFLVVICLVFSSACVSKEVPVTETYYETVYRTESYVEYGEEQRVHIKPAWTRQAWVGLGFVEWEKTESWSFFEGYDISLAKDSESQVELTLWADSSAWAILVVDLTGLGPLSVPPARSPLGEKVVIEDGQTKIVTDPASEEWLASLNAIVADPKRILYLTTLNQYTSRKITVITTGVDEFMMIISTPPSISPIIERVQLIWQSKSVEERQIPYEVEKERTVTKIEKVPIWEAVFGE